MRIEIGRLTLDTGREVTFFVDRVRETDEIFYLRVSPRGGVLRLPLNDAIGQPFYSEALEMAQALAGGP